MTRLLFTARSIEDRRKIVEFWNPYCKDYNEYNGSCDNYAIDYESDCHGSCFIIKGYYASSNIATLKDTKSEIRTFITIPDFMNFPKRVRDKMIERSVAQSPIPFVFSVTADTSSGGFTWSDSDEGQEFWTQVICEKDFDLFDSKFNINSKSHESRLCNKETPFGGNSDRNPSSIRSRFNKARIAVQPLSYQKVFGRG